MDPEVTPLSRQATFCFSCNPALPCFNDCCRDLNQFLTPYDVLRLKNHLGLPSGQFLAQYTAEHIGPESGLPVVTLKPCDRQDRTCPFVTPQGCRVYENRPSSCRTYPLMRVVGRNRQTGEMSERFMVLKEPHCRGFEQGDSRTAAQWISEQKVAGYNEINDKLMQIISLKNTRMPGGLDGKARRLVYTALYDLDGFRSQIFDNGLAADRRLDSALGDKALEDDVALLELGMQWIKQVLLGGG